MKRTFAYVAAIALFSTPLVAMGAGLVPCGGRGEAQCGLSHLITLGNNIITFLVYLATLIAVILLAIAGFKLVLSQGNASAMEQAKSRIWNVFIGFLIILLAYLVVQTILMLLTGGGFEKWKISQSTVSTASPQQQTTQDNTTTGTQAGCSNCVSITSAQCKSSESCTVSSAYAERLAAIDSDITITEAYPPTRTHQNACHSNGTCTDVVFSDRNFTPERVRAFQAEAAAAGFRAVYEPGPGGSCAGISNCQENSVTRATGDHFSLYLQ